MRWLFLIVVLSCVLSMYGISSRVGSSPLFRQRAERPVRSVLVASPSALATEATGSQGLNEQGLGVAVGTNGTAAEEDPADRTLAQASRSSDPTVTPINAAVGLSETSEAISKDQDSSIIPKLIHQSWKSRHNIPERFKPWMRSWVEMHPTWKYVFWTDQDNIALFERLYPKYLHVAKAVDKIGLADMSRYALLHHMGGLYVDADFECKKPFDSLHQTHQVFLSSEPLVHTVLLEGSQTLALCNALMASIPKHPFWVQVLDAIKVKFERDGNRRGDYVAVTGPRIVKETYFNHFKDDQSVSVLPSEYFYPEIAYWNRAAMNKSCKRRHDEASKEACAWLDRYPKGEFTNNTRATHHWQCTWCRGEQSPVHLSLKNDIFPTQRVYYPRIVGDSIVLESGQSP